MSNDKDIPQWIVDYVAEFGQMEIIPASDTARRLMKHSVSEMFQFAVEIDPNEPLPHKAAHIVVRFVGGKEVKIDKSRTYTLDQFKDLLND